MITISFDDRSVIAALRQLQGNVGDMTPAMNEIGMELEGRISARFEAERDPSGQAWKPWATSTAKAYPKSGNKRILDRTSDMLRSLNYQADRDSVTVSFGVDYAIYHEFGTKRMPRRGLVMEDPDESRLSGEDERNILDIVTRYLSV